MVARIRAGVVNPAGIHFHFKAILRLQGLVLTLLLSSISYTLLSAQNDTLPQARKGRHGIATGSAQANDAHE